MRPGLRAWINLANGSTLAGLGMAALGGPFSGPSPRPVSSSGPPAGAAWNCLPWPASAGRA